MQNEKMVKDERIGRKTSKTKAKGRFPFSTVVIVLFVCCFLSVGVTFFHGSILHGLDDSSTPSFITNNGKQRPVLASDLRIAGLSCSAYGGPADHIAQEMVYWQDIPQDSKHKSPFLDKNVTRYMTFEPDGGGWNNIRMAMETVLAMAAAMGRTLVLPPEQEMYLLGAGGVKQRKDFSFNHFFPMDVISAEEEGLEIITMEEFLQREGVTGRLRDQNGIVTFPPHNRTNWDGMSQMVKLELEPWLQQISFMPSWDPNKCMAAFPSTSNKRDIDALLHVWESIKSSGGFPPAQEFVNNPVPVHASIKERLSENNKDREYLCIYNQTLQQEPLVHFHGKKSLGGRLLVHFYAFLFFEDWRQDLWTKRFVRDHIRYIDEIQCAAARVLDAVRRHARKRDPQNKEGHYDAFHVRRGEFQYRKTRVSAHEIYDISKDQIPDGTTVYVATDERNKDFFKGMAAHYDLVYLDDFADVLGDLNTNLYGMVDQLVASRSRVFFGCWFSTFTAYINRIRGYHADRLKLPGFQKGVIESYYYALPEFKMRMKEYWPVSGAFHAREFPVSWRNIDHGIGELST